MVKKRAGVKANEAQKVKECDPASVTGQAATEVK